MSGPSRRLKNERPEVEVDVAQPKKKCGEVRCKVCLQPHALRLCPRFRAMDPARRRKAVMQFGYCFNCLAESHKRTDCRSRKRCMECCGEHHTMLHPRFVGNQRKREDPPRAVASRPQKVKKAPRAIRQPPQRDSHQRRSDNARRRNNASRRVARNPETQQQRTISGRCTCGHNPTNSTTVSPNTGHGPATIVIHVHSGSH
ncbi:uncharacterized protein LOC142239776 [Haematobia irritans]|uniref:uncharacterized protein LOC142239776 n=1 Tax=Haematobia irritans TaxID=7368 RepID=UPI003F4F87C6